MTSDRQIMTTADIAQVLAVASASTDVRDLYAAVEQLAARVSGFVLFTVLKYVDDGTAVERVYSSDEQAYPVGGRKQLSSISMNHAEMDRGQVFLAANRDEVKQTYPDHELIFSLGITAIMNAPIHYQGRRLGTLNLSGVEGGYGDADKANARILAGLLAPALLVDAGAPVRSDGA